MRVNRDIRINPTLSGRGGASKPRPGDGGPGKKKLPPLKNVWREAREIVWQHRGRLAVGLLLMLVSRLAGLVTPATSKVLIDEVIGNNRGELLAWLAAAVGVATVIQASSSYALSQILSVAAQRAITDIRRSVQEHVIRLPIRFFDSTQTGVLISRIMADAEGIRNLVGTGLVQMLGGLITALLAMAVLFYLNWKLTLITLAILGVFGICLTFALTRLRPLFRERGRINAEVTGRLNEMLNGIRVIKSYTAERREDLVFTKGSHRLFRIVAATITGNSMLTALSTTITGAVAITMITVGGNAILDGNMTLGDFVMYIFFTGMLASPVIQLSTIGTQISEAFAGLDRIRELRRMTTEDANDGERHAVESVDGHVEFRDVCFEYDPGVPVLKNISFESRPGTTTALVGSSGSGKSTLVSLVMTFNRPGSGSILVDGRDLAELRLRDYRNHLGIVLQDNFLFDGTIAENIRFARPDATMEEVESAGRIANCHEFVSEMELRYDTVIGERGVRLSGGQRQRLAIARAILADPRILILDEATSSLDSESEALIQASLNALRRGRTTFVIAHRLSTIISADQILVMEQGEIVERGTHGELLELNGRYRQLYDRQYRFEANRYVNPGEELNEPEHGAIGHECDCECHDDPQSAPRARDEN